MPDALRRLEAYQAARAGEEEHRKVAAALGKPPAERTEAERAIIAYSVWGTAATSCHCRP